MFLKNNSLFDVCYLIWCTKQYLIVTMIPIFPNGFDQEAPSVDELNFTYITKSWLLYVNRYDTILCMHNTNQMRFYCNLWGWMLLCVRLLKFCFCDHNKSSTLIRTVITKGFFRRLTPHQLVKFYGIIYLSIFLLLGNAINMIIGIGT